MRKVVVECSNGHRFRCEAEHLGRRVKCPRPGCEQRFVLQSIEQPPPQTPIDAHPVEPIPLEQPPAAAPVDVAEPTPSFNELLFENRRQHARNRERRFEYEPTGPVGAIKCLLIAGVFLWFSTIEFDPNESGLFLSRIPRMLGEYWPLACYIVAGLCVLGAVVAVLPDSWLEAPAKPANRPQVKPQSGLQPDQAAGTSYAPVERNPAPTVGPAGAQAMQDVPPDPRAAGRTQSPNREIRSKITELNSPASNWISGLLTLAISVALFFVLGLFALDLTFVVLLIAVVFVHECGHLLAMWAFGYRNTRMFFIPLFGAAVTGDKAQVKGWQETIVALAGPVPGLVIGFVLLAMYLQSSSSTTGLLAGLFIALNGFNLLPLYPMDGGQVLNNLVFCRSRYAELTFRTITALGILAIAIASLSIIFILFGLMTLLSVRHVARTSRIVNDLHQRLPDDMYGDFEQLPPAVRDEIIRTTRAALSNAADTESIAQQVRDVWRRLNVRPPGVIATFGLLGVYGASLISAIIVPLMIYFVSFSGELPRPNVDGFVSDIVAGFQRGLNEGLGDQSPVIGAVMDDDLVSLRFWLKTGVDVDKRDEYKQTALHYAAAEDKPEALSLLLEYGASVDVQDEAGGTPLMRAVEYENVECAQLLIQAGADPELADEHGHGPLIAAIYEDTPRILRMLLDAGADPTHTCANGHDVLEHARHADAELKSRGKMIQLIQRHMP